jgi:hypothetical protein
MLHARGDLRGSEVSAGGFEKLQNRFVLERRRIRHVNDDLRIAHCVTQPFAGDCVDTLRWRSGHHFMSSLAENRNNLRSDQSAAADDDDFHGSVLL